MSFLTLGFGAFLAGLAALAGLLFLLHRLRVKFTEREVVTNLFWKQAMEETRARILVKRFRHPLAYLLALAIAALTWLALAEPSWNRDEGTDYVLLLDGSAGMAREDRFERAATLLREEAERLPATRRRVYFCGADARLVLDRGEETCLLMPRLAQLSPEASPASVERAIHALVAEGTSARQLKFLVVGDAPVSPASLAMLPRHALVERLRLEQTPPLDNNAGIAALGVAPAASGTFDRVDVRIELAGPAEAGMAISLGGQKLNQTPTREGGAYYLRDLPARGEVLEVALTAGGSLTLDDRARITLPARRTVAVAVDKNLDNRFHALIEADPALVAATGEAQVVVGGAADGSLPAIEMVTGNGIAVIYEQGLPAHELERLQARFSATGLDRVGLKLGAGPETSGGFALMPRYVAGPRRKVQIGFELLGADYDFTQTIAFPLFVSSAIRWLAGVEAVGPFAVAGERSPEAGQFALAGSDYAPPRAGRYPGGIGGNIEVSLAAIRPPDGDGLKAVARTADSSLWPSLFAGCILLALVLVGGEWWLFQKGRIP